MACFNNSTKILIMSSLEVIEHPSRNLLKRTVQGFVIKKQSDAKMHRFENYGNRHKWGKRAAGIQYNWTETDTSWEREQPEYNIIEHYRNRDTSGEREQPEYNIIEHYRNRDTSGEREQT